MRARIPGGFCLKAALALVLFTLMLVLVGSAAAVRVSPCIQVGSTEHCSYSPTGTEQALAVPAGVTEVTISAVGAPGLTPDPNYGGQGGLGGTASAQVSVTPGSTLYVEVGRGGTYGAGGWNGGGGGESGGGGASDVRTVSCAATCANGGGASSLASRLVVAGGGGGGGYPGAFNWIQLAGNRGGGAGYPGVSYGPGMSDPVDGGGGGTLSAGGAGGPGENGGGAGQAGALGLGGAGNGVAGPGGGGGGGGGYYGGGGGGNGGTVVANGARGPGDGGGGGSSYAPGGITAFADPGTPPSVTISFDLPQPPSITSYDNTTFIAGQPNIFTVTTMGAPALSEDGTLPDGVSFTDNGDGTATLSGVPASDAAGTYPLTINASNGVPPDASQSFTLTVVTNPPAIVGSYPLITGDTSAAGGTLSVSDGDWSSYDPPLAYQWSQCAADGSDCVAITGATSNQYVTQVGDLGHEIEASVTATNAGGSVTESDTTNATIGSPTSVTLPDLSGDYSDIGGVLSATDGMWTGSPTSIAYQWISCTDNSGDGCAPISGATSNQYAITNADVGQYLQVEVTASNDYGSWSVWVYELNQIGSPANATPPTIGGTAVIGQKLTGIRGTWHGSPTGYTYQWERCDSSGNGCAAITSGATALSYTVRLADAGYTLVFAVRASNAIGQSAAAQSNPTSVIAGLTPTNINAPGITGNAVIGGVLTGSRGTWTRATGYAYQWERCDSSGNGCAAITPGATGLNYTVRTADAGHELVFQVTATNAAGSTSAASGPSGVAPVNNSLPSISPATSVVVGTLLTGSRGSWTGATGYTYQWERCDSSGNGCVAITPGATGLSYTVRTTDAGHELVLQVTATSAAGSTAAASGPIGVAPVNISLPAISPATSVVVGATLTGNRGSWTGDTAYTYQWERCDSSGNGCVAITPGATGLNYTVRTADVGHELELKVTATNSFGSTTEYSNTTNPVTP
jgi:Glycine rich protein/Putative Ig domain